jgi:GH24 family phage-related lysozyme (muramidase)
MHLKSANLNYCWHSLFIVGIVIGFTLNNSKSHATTKILVNKSNKSNKSALVKTKSSANAKLPLSPAKKSILASLPVHPATSSLVKQFEGFRSLAYIDSSGLLVIGYGQTKVNGRSIESGQYISPEQANIALQQELSQIQQLVLAHVHVDLNPYQLGALTSLVYNAGSVVIKNSTLIKKLNTGDYLGASKEFLRWNKANSGGKLIVLPGLTERRIAEQKLFLTPHQQLVSNN